MHFTVPALLALSLTSFGLANEALDIPVFACNNQIAMCCEQANTKTPQTCVHATGALGQYTCIGAALPPHPYCCDKIVKKPKKGNYRGIGCTEAEIGI